MGLLDNAWVRRILGLGCLAFVTYSVWRYLTWSDSYSYPIPALDLVFYGLIALVAFFIAMRCFHVSISQLLAPLAALGWKNGFLAFSCLAWLWWFFANPAFLALLLVPVLAALGLSIWKKKKAFELFEPMAFGFLLALALSALAMTAYRYSFDVVFRGIVLAFPLFTVVPLFVLLALLLSVYGFLSLRELERNGDGVSVNSFYLCNLAALALAGVVIWAIAFGGLSL